MSGYTSVDAVQPVLLQGTSLINCAGGVVGSAAAGAAFDSVLHGVYIVLNATAATVSIGGFLDSNGAAQSLLISGQTTIDYVWTPPNPLLNRGGALTFTPSIAAKVWVMVRCYVGPERPETRVTD